MALDDMKDIMDKSTDEQLANMLWWTRTMRIQHKICPLIVGKFDEIGLLARGSKD